MKDYFKKYQIDVFEIDFFKGFVSIIIFVKMTCINIKIESHSKHFNIAMGIKVFLTKP